MSARVLNKCISIVYLSYRQRRAKNCCLGGLAIIPPHMRKQRALDPRGCPHVHKVLPLGVRYTVSDPYALGVENLAHIPNC